MLVAEALLLLLLDDEKGSTSSGYARDEGLAGAVLLAELNALAAELGATPL